MRVHTKRVWLLAALLGFWVAVALGLAILAVPSHAQGTGNVNSARQETTPAGLYASMWNATGSQIDAGTVVMTDTVSATVGQAIPLGKGFEVWDGDVSNLYRVVGILLEDCPDYSQGRVLVRGTYNYALMSATGYTAYTKLRPSLTVAGALEAQAAGDTTYSRVKIPVGIFQRYVSGSTLRAQVWVNFLGLQAAAR